MKILWKGTVSAEFRAIRSKLFRSCAFAQNSHTWKLGEITIFYAVEVDPVEPVQMHIYQSNIYRKDLSWLHFNDEPRVQKRRQVLDQQSYTPVSSVNWSFRLVPEGKAGITWVIKIRIIRKVFCKLFCFTKSRKKHFRSVKQKRYSRFTFVENTISNTPKVIRVKFLGSDWLFCFISISIFGNLKNIFTTITSLSWTSL